jgi:cysteine-rich repeat protein
MAMTRHAPLFAPILFIAAFGCMASESIDCPGGGVCPPGTECRADRAREVCVPVSCGNGTLDAGEDCDDGNTTSGDGCQSTCRVPDRPSARCGVAMTYDSLRKRLVLFGGLKDMTLYADMWLWDGTDWTVRSASPQGQFPEGRAHAAMTYDVTRGHVLMFGGVGGSGQFLDDFWEWNDAGWVRITPEPPLPPVSGIAGLAYDRRRDRVVLIGSPSDSNVTTETWEWDGVRWSQGVRSSFPPPPTTSMIYDESRSEVMLAGGAWNDDTWLWNGARWQTIPGAEIPSQVRSGKLAYDSSRERPVLVGVVGTLGESRSATYELTSTGWTERVDAIEPPDRELAGVAYSVDLQSVLLFGGVQGREFEESHWYDDLWAWSGVAWTEQE